MQHKNDSVDVVTSDSRRTELALWSAGRGEREFHGGSGSSGLKSRMHCACLKGDKLQDAGTRLFIFPRLAFIFPHLDWLLAGPYPKSQASEHLNIQMFPRAQMDVAHTVQVSSTALARL